MTTNPQTDETARALLWRHGLPEDIVDGALCLHAQELAAQQRAALEHGPGADWDYETGRNLADLIDPTKPAAVSVPAPAPTDWIDGHPQLEAIAAAVWERCGRSDSGTCVEDDPRNIAVAALAAVLPAPTACPDPIECSHEAALGQAQQEVRRLGLMVDEYGHGASALTGKLKRVRDLHRETCILAHGEVSPTAFTCGMCELLDAPASGSGRVADETQADDETQAAAPVERCAHCRHPKRDHDGRADHRARSSPLVAGDPWCHACNEACEYAEQPAVVSQPNGEA